MDNALVKAVRLAPPDGSDERSGYPWDLPAISALSCGLELHAKVTYPFSDAFA